MKKEIFLCEDVNRYIAEEFSKATGKTKVSFFNECIHHRFQPKNNKFREEYERLIRLYNNEVQKNMYRIDEEGSLININHLSQYELKTSIGRTAIYCLKHHISSCEPFKLLIFKHYGCNVQDNSWQNEQDKMILKDIEDALSMINQQMRYYGEKHPILMLMEIFNNWELFWDDDRSYRLLAAIIYCWEPIEPISLFETIYLLYEVDEIILDKTLRKQVPFWQKYKD